MLYKYLWIGCFAILVNFENISYNSSTVNRAIEINSASIKRFTVWFLIDKNVNITLEKNFDLSCVIATGQRLLNKK